MTISMETPRQSLKEYFSINSNGYNPTAKIRYLNGCIAD
jgi:hypothetical protein